jgi:hypothetical protein
MKPTSLSLWAREERRERRRAEMARGIFIGNGKWRWRSAGVVEWWRAGELESWRAGELESWRAGVLECWSAGVLEGWWRGGIAL